MVNAVRQLVDHYLRYKSFATLQGDLRLTTNQYTNFQKLQYFGLAFRTRKGWFPTPRAIAFIHGRIKIADRAMTFGKDILAPDHPAWQGVKVAEHYVWQIDITSYKRAESYRAEKTVNPNQASLFP
jgi:hypothetical protein